MHDVTPHTPLVRTFVASLHSSPCQHLTRGAAKLSVSHVSKHVQCIQMGKERLDSGGTFRHMYLFISQTDR